MKIQIVALFAAAICFAFPTHQASAAASGSLTLTTYNIHSAIPDGSSGVSRRPTSVELHNVSDVLTTAGADIIALQEVRNHWTRPARGKANLYSMDMPLHLATLMDMNFAFGSTIDSTPGYPENRGYTEWGNADKWTNNGARHGEYGNAVLTRFDLAAPPANIKLPRGDADGMKKGDEPRNAVRVELKDAMPGLGHIVVYAAHLQHNNGKTREAQMRELLRHAKADASTATVFIMGDMNHHPHKGEPDLLGMVKDAGFHDLAAEFAAKNGTQPANTIGHGESKIRIDYVFCSRPVKVKDVTVMDTPVSDHLPVTVTLDLQ